MHAAIIIIVAAFLVSGCASSIIRLNQRETQASKVYTVGSGFSGGGSSLLFFGDGHFEQWGYSDIEARRNVRGRFTSSGDRTLLFVAGKEPWSLFVRHHQGVEYLADATKSEHMPYKLVPPRE
jgi:hypothetical protein